MSENLKKHLGKLSKRGPHRVLVGDLSYAGLEGKVYTPSEGSGIPAVAFGHDWMKDVSKYHGTLRHLASWGIAVAAPNTEVGFVPDHGGLAADLETSLQIMAGVKLGAGNVVVAPGKLGVVGHGMGGGAAILTATDNPKVSCVAALYPAVTTPSAELAAGNLDVPGLVIGSGKDSLLDAGNPAKVAHRWKGQVAYREIDKGTQHGFTEDTLFKLATGLGGAQTKQIEIVRGLLTGFLLHQLAGEKKYEGFSAPDATGKGFVSYSGEDLADQAGFAPDEVLPF